MATARVIYFHNDIELKIVTSKPNAFFESIGGVKSKHNYDGGYSRMVGTNDNGKTYLPVTRKIYFKKNPSLHKCNTKCQGASGHDCECSCNGKNHGINK